MKSPPVQFHADIVRENVEKFSRGEQVAVTIAAADV
jgi:hypothetical protein